MKLRKRPEIKVTAGLMLTPMLDVLTVVLIFLILNFSPERAQLNTGDNIQLPNAELQLENVPQVKIEITADALKLNGSVVEGLNPQTAEPAAWAGLKEKIHATQLPSEASNEAVPVLLIADRGLDYDHVDRTVARLASLGYGDIYFLTNLEERK